MVEFPTARALQSPRDAGFPRTAKLFRRRMNEMIRMNRALWLPGVIWTSPNTLLGLLVGVAGLLCGARLSWRPQELALVFADMPTLRHGWPCGALTLGNVIVHTGHSLDRRCLTYAHRAERGCEPLIALAEHEYAHVRQYMLLGPLFLPLYLLCGGVSARNPFERAADRYAAKGRGWWPWNRR